MYPTSTINYGGYAQRNPIQALLSTRTPQVSTGGLLQGANSMFQEGMNSFQKVADDLDSVKRNKAINTLLSTVDMTDPYSGQQSAISGLLGIRGVDPKDAINIGTSIASPYIDKQTFDETARHNKAMETKQTAKGYGAYTNEYGDVVIYNKDTGLPVGSSTSSSNASSIPLLTKSGESGSESNVGALTGTNAVDVSKGNVNPNGIPKPQIRQNTGTQDVYRIPTKFIDTTKVKEPDGNGGYTERTVTIDKRNPDVELEHLGRGYFRPTGKSVTSEVPEKQSTNEEKAIKGVSSVVEGFGRVKELFHPELVGPYDSRVTSLKSTLGIQGDKDAPDSTEKGNELESAVAQIVNDIRHSQFGSALTGYEIEEWKKGVPDVGMNELEFIPKWNQFIDTTLDHGNDALKNLRNQKRYNDARNLENEMKDLEQYKLDLKDYEESTGPSLMSPLGREQFRDDMVTEPMEVLKGLPVGAVDALFPAVTATLDNTPLDTRDVGDATGKLIGGTVAGGLAGGRTGGLFKERGLRSAGTAVDDLVGRKVNDIRTIRKDSKVTPNQRESVRQQYIQGARIKTPESPATGLINATVDKLKQSGVTKGVLNKVVDVFNKYKARITAPISDTAKAEVYRGMMKDLMDSGLTYQQSLWSMEKIINNTGMSKAGTTTGTALGALIGGNQ